MGGKRMPEPIRKHLLEGLAAVVLLLFAAVWGWIGFELLTFDSSKTEPTLSFTDFQLGVAGFLASAVGAGTASVLGFEIQNVQKNGSGQQSLGGRVSKAAGSSGLLVAGIIVYVVVGVAVASVFFFRSDVAPDMVNTFSMGILGWLAGAFSAVFRTKTA
jgi:TRAP-type C4-dicarboxylate transport system permease small subunit